MELSKAKNFNMIVSLLVKDKINSTSFIIKTNLTNSGIDLKKQIENERDNIFFDKIRLISSGSIVNDFYSLQHQGFKNGSIIFLIPEKKLKNVSNIIQISPLKNYNFTTCNEASRLSDIMRFKVESNTRSYRKLVRRYNNMNDNQTNTKPK